MRRRRTTGSSYHVKESFTDEEMRKLCARGMGIEWMEDYDPIHNDAEADALVVRFNLKVESGISGDGWRDCYRATIQHTAETSDDHSFTQSATKQTRNRAIVTVVANYMWGRV